MVKGGKEASVLGQGAMEPPPRRGSRHPGARLLRGPTALQGCCFYHHTAHKGCQVRLGHLWDALLAGTRRVERGELAQGLCAISNHCLYTTGTRQARKQRN